MYRILTERKPNLTKILDGYFNAYTTYPANGRWDGKNELSTVIEIDNVTRAKVRAAALAIKKANRQQAVLIQRVTTQPELV
jgi:hypothetical protein